MECTIALDTTMEEDDECIYYLEDNDTLLVILEIYKKMDRKVHLILIPRTLWHCVNLDSKIFGDCVPSHKIIPQGERFYLGSTLPRYI